MASVSAPSLLADSDRPTALVERALRFDRLGQLEASERAAKQQEDVRRRVRLAGGDETRDPTLRPVSKGGLPAGRSRCLRRSQREWLADLAERDRSRPNASGADYTTWTLNIARCLFGIHHGHGCTKPEAARWLVRQLPELAPTLKAALRARTGDAAVTIDRGRFRRFADEARTLTSRTKT